ncbi:hypothetical protein KC963_02955, partial [Candidatus Saccharibacteria bacterium]|nr:hypothetical protein [Candidatus Saccharibacteria bacterium]
AFVINRRTIPDSYTSPDQLSAMYKEQGLPHPGYDCFVFKKDLYAQFIVGDVCIGTGQVDTPLVCSMIAAANKFGEFTDEHLTFHIGDSRQWLKWRYRDYFFHNCREASVSIRALLQGKAKQLPARGRILLWLRLPKNTVMIPMIKRLFSQ